MATEIVIVGGGPAGSATAIHLAHLLPSFRDRILLVDKKVFPREKPCGGGLSGRALGALDAMDVRVTVPTVDTDVARYRFGERLSSYHVPGACRVVRRAEFDAMLLGVVRERGVEVSEGEGLVSLAPDEGRPRVTTTRRSLAPRVVVGADGAGSLVRRLAGLPPPRAFTRLHQLEFPVREEETPDFLEGCFTFDYTPVPAGLQGYVWDFPSRINGRPYMNCGVFHRNASGPEPSRERLLALLVGHVARCGRDARAARLRSYPDVEYDPRAAIARPGVLLAGSAAGINPLTGEGIWQSFEYGRLAAESIAAAFGADDFRFADYGARVARSPMGRDLRLSRRLADLFYGRLFWTLYSFQEKNADLRVAFIQSFAGQFDLERIPKAPLVARWWWHLAFGSRRTPRPGPGPWAEALSS